MAQKQYTTYQADILSFELRDALLGILNPGRYRGFDSLTEYQAQSGTSLYVQIGQTNGQNKYDQTSPIPVLEAERSIAITTQGTIIAEDFAAAVSTYQATLTMISGGPTNGVYHLLYMEHAYLSGTPGANAAIYGWISGADDDTPPTLTSATKRIILGYFYEPPLGTTADFGDCIWYPVLPLIGDDDTIREMFQTDDNGIRIIKGTMPTSGEGIIGDRLFANNNYITDYDSITEVLEDLDDALKTEEDARIAVGNRAIDSGFWGQLTDNNTNDVDTNHHGLCPIAPDDITKFFRGDASWAVPPAGFIFPNSTSVYDYNSTAHGGSITMGTTQDLDLTQVPAGYNQVLLSITLQCKKPSDNPNGRYGAITLSTGGGYENRQTIIGPPPYEEAGLSAAVAYVFTSHQLVVPLNSSGEIQISYGNYSGQTTDWLYDIQIKVVGYR